MSQLQFMALPFEVLRDPNIGNAAKLLYGRLKLYAGKDGRCYPKQQTIATEMGMKIRQVPGRIQPRQHPSVNRECSGWRRSAETGLIN
jgi:hypothetical protein